MAYSQIQKVEANVHDKASAEQFHDVLCGKTITGVNFFFFFFFYKKDEEFLFNFFFFFTKRM